MTDSQTTQNYDIAIIGAGPGGYSTALRAAELGKKVALIEKSPYPGGVCLHEGCVPSKALLTAAHTIRDAKHADVMGLTLSLQSVDLGKLVDYKESVVNQMTKGLESLLRRRKVTTITGTATMTSAHDISVELAAPDSGTSTDGDATAAPLQLHADDVVIATGSRPRHFPGTEFTKNAILSSEAALNLHQIPSSVVILGSGPIGLEFATLWSSVGAQVTLLEVADRILPSATPRVSAVVSRGLKRAGIAYETGVTIDSVEEGVNQTATVRYREAHSEGDDTAAQHSVTAQFALVAIGRLPNTGADWFGALGIELDERGLVKTDPYGRTSVPGVWALGDITPGKQLAHRAFAQGLVVAESIAGVDTEPVDDHNVPAVTFALTEVGSVGYAADEARANPDFSDVEETTFPMLGNARVVMSGESGSVTVVSGIDSTADTSARVVLGVQMAGPGVSELTAEAEQLVGNRVPLHEAARLVHPHPTLSETLGEALLSADGRPLHTR
ncbi:MAG: dihydrolipoyl dehydrogenase [Bifidobacteriaceae bacterium]|jgi:dihydrolipoamide dehydrogenase|nr:dihydrolipoyl dehydrogenase [Bifidobacteriaceae bacterium]